MGPPRESDPAGGRALRVEEPGLALIQSFPYSAPFEEVRLKR